MDTFVSTTYQICSEESIGVNKDRLQETNGMDHK
jgi:hypothetical protein